MKAALYVAATGLLLALGQAGSPEVSDCADDAVKAGTVCIDKYEASLWYVPPGQGTLIKNIQKGKARHADLMAGGALQVGLASGDAEAAGCPVNGNGCVNIYAVSIPAVTPAGFVSYFQAVAAARNSRKRLPTNQEWQAAALGTPDGPPCNVGPNGAIAPTGIEPACVSDVGAFDMVGNQWERVAEWADFANSCFSQSPTFGGDLECFGGPGYPGGPTSHPSVIIRGGFFGPSGLGGGTNAGVFAIRANVTADFSPQGTGFRGVR